MTKLLKIVLGFASFVVVIIGFKLVTQSGLTGAAAYVQNDGYASSGGVLILLGGFLLGLIIAFKTTK
jgi:hypothetical protein